MLAGDASGVVSGVPKNPEAGVLFPDPPPCFSLSLSASGGETRVSVDERLDSVSTALIVDDRFGSGKPLKDVKSQDIAFFGVGRADADVVDPASEFELEDAEA